jgi:hypothetical protein
MTLISTLTRALAALAPIAAGGLLFTLAPLFALILLYPLAGAGFSRAVQWLLDRQEEQQQMRRRPGLPYYSPKPYFG